jgi:hypothetical protein
MEFLHPPVSSSVVSPNILLSSLFSHTLNLSCFLMRETKFLTHINKRVNYIFLSFDLCIFK